MMLFTEEFPFVLPFIDIAIILTNPFTLDEFIISRKSIFFYAIEYVNYAIVTIFKRLIHHFLSFLYFQTI